MGLNSLVGDKDFDSDKYIENTDFNDGFVAGLVVGEGSFHIIRNGEGEIPHLFIPQFALGMGDYDRETVSLVRDYLGAGRLDTNFSQGGKINYTRVSCKNVDRIKRRIIPFFDRAFDMIPVRTDKHDSYDIWRTVVMFKIDGRRTTNEYLAEYNLLAAYAKDKINQNTPSRRSIPYEQVRDDIYDVFPEVVEDKEEEIKRKIDKVIR